jgi:hypothetical protein
VLFGEQTPGALAEAIERFERLTLDPQAPRRNAARFGRERFRREMAQAIDRAAARKLGSPATAAGR